MIDTDLLSIVPVMRNPRASSASTVRQASLPLPFALDSANKVGALNQIVIIILSQTCEENKEIVVHVVHVTLCLLIPGSINSSKISFK